MDWSAIVAAIAVLATAASGVIGWWSKELSKNQDKIVADQSTLARQINNLEVKVSDHYVKREDFQSVTNQIFLKLDKILDKLDTKVDK
jgi:hypothetical protein